MKTEEQILLNYMYQEGYTDEEMFDKTVINKVRLSNAFILYKLRFSIPGMIQVFTNVVGKIADVVIKVCEKLKNMWPVVKEMILVEPEIFEHKPRIPLDFTRHVKMHQVIDRKPRHLIKKIIR